MKMQRIEPKVAMLSMLVPVAPPNTERITGRRLQRRNARLLSRNPLCVECMKHGQFHAAVQWDHVIPLWKGGPDDESNLQGLCTPHHKAKSAREATERHG